jgi:hypothetical protein
VQVRVTGVLVENSKILILRQEKDTRPIRGVEFVPFADLPLRGFGERFGEVAMAGFPHAGSYMGPKSAIGL